MAISLVFIPRLMGLWQHEYEMQCASRLSIVPIQVQQL